MVAKVVLPLALSKELSYDVPELLQNNVAIGKRVLVEVGVHRLYVGIITELFSSNTLSNNKGYELKSLLFVLDDKPCITTEELSFWEFLSFYYMIPLGSVLSVALPSDYLPQTTTTVSINYDLLSGSTFVDKREYKVRDKLIAYAKPAISFDEFIRLLGRSYAKLFVTFLNVGIFESKSAEPIVVQRIGVEHISLSLKYTTFDALQNVEALLQRSRTLLKLFGEFLALLPQKDEEVDLLAKIPIHKLLQKDPNKRVAYRRLLAKIPDLFVSTYQIEVSEQSYIGTQYNIHTLPKLSSHQPTLYKAFNDEDQYAFIAPYIKEVLSQGKRVLLLLPQSSTIEGDEAFIRPLLGLTDEPLFFLSGQTTPKQRIELRHRILETNEPLVIVGSRIATFIPACGLGLIIVAEEQDIFYKQQEPSPRFHARDSLIFRAKQLRIPILLTAVTPSLETELNVRLGKYSLIKTPNPYAKTQSPDVEVLNLKRERAIHRIKCDCIISKSLRDAISKTLTKNKKVLLIAARKGFAPYLYCTHCGETIKCPQCSVSLTYHQFQDRLTCSYCGFTMRVPILCPMCSSRNDVVEGTLKKIGFGTERIETELQTIFPMAKLLRIDAETTRNKGNRRLLKDAIINDDSDIIIGTTLLSRIASLTSVGLVAIPQFDLLAAFPDFRNDEQLYTLFIRLQRRYKNAKFFFQANDPQHLMLHRFEANHVDETINDLLAERELFKFPPYHRLIRIILKDKRIDVVNFTSHELTRVLLQHPNCFADVQGPIEPYVSKVKLKHIRHITLRLEQNASSKLVRNTIFNVLDSLKQVYPAFRRVEIFFDVDPY